MTASQPKERWQQGAREFAALGLWALAVYTVLSLVSRDTGREPNLGGPLGNALAAVLEYAFGHAAYFLVLFLVWWGHCIWSATRIRAVMRYVAAGLILLLALSTVLGKSLAPPGDETGSVIAAVLPADFNLSSVVVLLVIVGTVGLLAKRGPREIALSSKSRSAKSASSPGSEQHGDSVPAKVPVDKVPALLPLRESSASTSSAPEPVILLAETARQRPTRVKRYKLPRLDLLDNPPLAKSKPDEEALERSARVLEQKLAGFGVQARVIEIQPGPVVTLYKLAPGEGVRVSQIVNLADDLSLVLRSPSVRILAPIPGEAAVGIEIANAQRETVLLTELLKAREFKTAASQLTLALGKDTIGRPVWADLAAMPHLLIAGTTGSGKSVSIHAMLASILFKATAEDVRLILIDAKMLELSVYEGIPHLLVPVVMDLDKAAAALSWATAEMEMRYRAMQELGVRNVDGYNRVIENGLLSRGTASRANVGARGKEADTPKQRLPKIVIVIDELADLLLSHGKMVERDITRLAQKARAAGIHLMLATQRPSVDVITGLIKANLPARISFQVSSRVDSRTILDSIGAERLLGSGDMLFLSPGSAELRRLQGPFVSEAEIRKLCDFLRAQGPPDYQLEILDTSATGTHDSSQANEQRDPLYDEALQIVLEAGQGSISMLQRRLRIGYNRAARIVEQMEQEGIVAPADGARPRELRARPTNKEE
ncbi:MAG: DNA translocase FtsK [Acidobacteriaceae bacterium]|nr:DNA translocase FtsK [Acidobacteriaceae bacterium]